MAQRKNNGWLLLGGLAAGVAGWYFLDPERGEDRRREFTGRVKRYARNVSNEVSKSARDAWNRTSGKTRQLWNTAPKTDRDDVVLMQRIRSHMGRIVEHSHKIQVACEDGVVTIWGSAAEVEIRELLTMVKSQPGVHEVWNHLEIEHQQHPTPANQALNRARRSVALNWSPSKRALIGSGGLATALYGLKRRDTLGISLSMLGGSLVAVSTLKKNLHSLLAFSNDTPGFELQETIRVNAPISDIYDFWTNPLNYPRIFEHIDAVEQIGENLYRWSMTGPAGIPIRWDGTITRAVPNTLVEWKSLPGATVGNFGMVHFDPNYDASTRVHVRMFYHPPAGILGRILAEMLGADPGKVIHEDLKRMKMLFENDESVLKRMSTSETNQLLKTAGC